MIEEIEICNKKLNEINNELDEEKLITLEFQDTITEMCTLRNFF